MIQGSEAEMCCVDYWEAELHGRLLSCCCLRLRGAALPLLVVPGAAGVPAAYRYIERPNGLSMNANSAFPVVIAAVSKRCWSMDM
ncbi:hypothetical protein CA51_07130 [Rosistilla oblonga]|nr:hypothetical protein CA51_07130 [Rosistilla oblonga]